jgi:hypothetical protein
MIFRMVFRSCNFLSPVLRELDNADCQKNVFVNVYLKFDLPFIFSGETKARTPDESQAFPASTCKYLTGKFF